MAGAGIAADLLVHVGADIKDATDGLNKVGSATDSTAAKFGKAGLAMGGASLAIVGGLGMAINTAADYEASLSQITALGGEFATNQKAIGDLALDIGQKTAFSASEGALAIAELAKAGVPLADILGGAAMEAANLAAAGGQSIPEAAITMSNAMNMFSLSGKDATMVADVFAAAANASASDVSTLSAALAQGGSAASQLGIPLNDTVTALALFSNYGIQGSDAGTSLKTMLMSLSNPSAEAASLMQELGIAAFDASGNFVGMEQLSGQLQTALGGLTKEQQAQALATIFGSDASRVANVLMQEGAEGYAEMAEQVNKQGAAGEMARAKMDNLNGAIEQLKGSLETAMIIIGSSFIPVLRKMADGITKGLNIFLKLPKPIQKIGGVVAAGTAAFLALGAAIGIVIGFAAPAIAAFTAIAAPILILVGVVAALYLAWKTNFLGIQDITKQAFGAIMDVINPFIDLLGKVAHGSDITKETLAGIPGPLQNIAKVLGLVVRGFVDFYNALAGGKGLSAALGELGEVLTSSKMVDALSALGSQILGAIESIDWAAVGSALWNGLLAAIEFIQDVTAPILGKLGDLTVALGQWLWDEASSVDWATILSNAAALAGDVTSKIVSGLGDLGGAIRGWYDTAVASVNWGGMGQAAGAKVSSFISDLIPKLGDLGASLKTWFDTSVNSVDWGNLGFIVGQKVGDVAGVLGPKALELITGFADWLRNNWKTVGTVLLGLILALPVVIGYIGKTLIPKAGEFLAGFAEGLGINWTAIANWLKGLPGMALAAIPGLTETLLQKGIDLFIGLMNGLIAMWPAIKTWLGTVGSLAVTAIGELTETLKQKGIDLFIGLLNGLLSYWPTITTFVASLPGLIVDKIGDVSNILYNAGYDLLWGFAQGLWGYAESLYSTARTIVDNVIDILKDIPGFSPIEHVGQYFGEKLGGGFAEGLLEAIPSSINAAVGLRDDTIAQLARPVDLNLATAFQPTATPMATGPAVGTTIIQHNNFQIDLEQFEDLAEAAAFVSSLNGTRILYKNEPLGGV